MGWFVFHSVCLFLFVFPSWASSLVPLCNHDDSSALLEFKNSFSTNISFIWEECEPAYYLRTKSWKNGTNYCLWDGVSCDTKSGYVIGLDLTCGSLQGKLHPNSTLFHLHHLQKLNLAFNDFSMSQISSGFSNLIALSHLNLSSSSFHGVISSEISRLSKLVSLDLSELDETIFELLTFEKFIKNTTDLKELALDGIDMSSITLSTLSLLVNYSASLVSLSLDDNKLQGKLASNILHLPNLQFLKLSSNFNLEGELPKVNWSDSLVHLDLSETSLLGLLPPFFESWIPDSFGKLRKLQVLDLSHNLLTSIGNLLQRNIDYIDLSFNMLEGEIPIPLFGTSFFSISNNKLNGDLSSRICNASSLEILNLSHNNLTGTLPQCLGTFRNLLVLDLQKNNLVGVIPKIYFEMRVLETMNFYGNQLKGQLPNAIAKCENLKVLDLGKNKIEGSFPSWLESLPELQVLVLRANRFNGTISSLKTNHTFPKLRVFDVSNNNFSGTLPTTYLKNFKGMVRMNSNDDLQYMNSSYRYYDSVVVTIKGFDLELERILTTFTTLDLSNNKFVGDIPTIIGELKSLKGLNLSCNKITGPIPHSFGGLKTLEWLDLSSNKLTGEIPEALTNLYFLSNLDLSHNLLTSTGNLSYMNIGYIDLSFNMFQGEIPLPPFGTSFYSISNNKLNGDLSSRICNASSLELLNLSHNNLTGKLPQCLGTLRDLSVLDVQKNNLVGVIPKIYFEMKVLKTMNLNGNQLKGPLPQVIAKCKNLEVLDLGENSIDGTFPSWLESLPELQVLVLRANRFNGTISSFKTNHTFPKLRVFDVSNNNFSGTLPTTYIKNFKGMVRVNSNDGSQYMSSSYYYDSVVVTIKGYSFELERILITLTILDLSNNKFEGEIPTIIGQLMSLKGLNLSCNKITGPIPQSFVGLENLEWLDLSSNKLTGEIPGVLTNLNFLSKLNLSLNQLEGIIPSGNQFNTFENDSYKGNPGLCGFPLSKLCHKHEELSRDSSSFEHEEEFLFGWKAVAIGYASGMVFGILLGCIVFLFEKPQWLIWFVEDIACLIQMKWKRRSQKFHANKRG